MHLVLNIFSYVPGAVPSADVYLTVQVQRLEQHEGSRRVQVKPAEDLLTKDPGKAFISPTKF